MASTAQVVALNVTILGAMQTSPKDHPKIQSTSDFSCGECYLANEIVMFGLMTALRTSLLDLKVYP